MRLDTACWVSDELGGGELELARVGDGDERADGIEIHNRWL